MSTPGLLMLLFEKMKNHLIGITIRCTGGVAVLITCLIMEVLYRAAVWIGFAARGLDFLILGFGFAYLLIELIWRVFIYMRKR